MNKSDSIKNLATALFKAQKQIKGALKNSENHFYKSDYADLESVWEAIRDPLFENELSVIQPTGHENNAFGVYTILMHSSGEYWSGFTEIRTKDAGPQAQGSGITYARRYGLTAMLGVFQKDDDGNEAHGNVGHPGAFKDEVKNKTNIQPNPFKEKKPADIVVSPDSPASGHIDFKQSNELKSLGLKMGLKMDRMNQLVLKNAGVEKWGEIPLDKFEDVKKSFEANNLVPF